MSNNTSLLPYQRIIFALDIPTFEEAKTYINLLKKNVGVFKVGMELFVREGPKVIQYIANETDAKIFLDLKFHDIPETVSRAHKAARSLGVDFVTVHCHENSNILSAAFKSANKKTSVLAVTVLTSLSKKGIIDAGIRKELQDPLKLALYRAEIAKKSGCAGVVCSGKEVKAISEQFGNNFTTVVPGVRPLWSNITSDDQSRTMTPFDAIASGADYLVVGRPIRDAKDPGEAANKIRDEIEKALNSSD
jgi:orotidine-5'-phosphate decarboxylase